MARRLHRRVGIRRADITVGSRTRNPGNLQACSERVLAFADTLCTQPILLYHLKYLQGLS